jgi:hypothetical protein
MVFWNLVSHNHQNKKVFTYRGLEVFGEANREREREIDRERGESRLAGGSSDQYLLLVGL